MILDYSSAAALLGLKITTLRSMVARRQVPHIRLGKQLVRFDLAELERWLGECRVAAEAEQR